MNKSILKLAIPNIISNITVPLLSMVDIALVGHLNSESYMGAIATCGIIFNFIYWSFSFLRMGTSGFTAQAFGASNNQESSNILLRSLTIGLIASVIIICIQKPIFEVAFWAIKSTTEVKFFASEYFYIYIWAAPAILGMYTFTGWFIGMQDARTPMIIAISVNIINIVLNLIFVKFFDLKIMGVALGSTIAQILGFLMALFFWYYKYSSIRNCINFQILKNLSALKSFFRVNIDIYIRTMLLILVTTFFTSISAREGDTILAANALLMQLFTLFSYIMDGFAYASEALTGRYIGAKKTSDINKLVQRLFLWGITLTILFTFVYYLFTDSILAIFTDKIDIIAICKQYEGWILFVPIAGFSAFLWDGIFVGATASKQMRNSMIIASASFFIIYYTTYSKLGNNALWLSFITYLAMRGVMQAFMYTSIRNRLLINENSK